MCFFFTKYNFYLQFLIIKHVLYQLAAGLCEEDTQVGNIQPLFDVANIVSAHWDESFSCFLQRPFVFKWCKGSVSSYKRFNVWLDSLTYGLTSCFSKLHLPSNLANLSTAICLNETIKFTQQIPSDTVWSDSCDEPFFFFSKRLPLILVGPIGFLIIF